MYALMGAGAYGCSGFTAPLIAHLRRVYALTRMTYGLEVFTLNSKTIHLMLIWKMPFVNCRQFMYLVISLLVLRAGYGI